MRRFQLLLFNTIQKEFRSKLLIFISVITVAIIFIANSTIGYLSEEYLSQMGASGAAEGAATGLIFVISMFTTLLATILGVNCLKSDIESNVAPLLLSFPVSRFEYMLSRILGSWLIVMVYYLFSVFMAQILLSSTVGTFVGGPHLIGSMFFTSLSKLFIIMASAAVGLAMPKIVAFVSMGLFSIVLLGSSSYFGEKEWNVMTEGLNLYKSIGLVIYGVFPRVGVIDDIGSGLLMKVPVEANIPWELAHYSMTVVVFFGIFYLVFRKKEI